MKYAIILTVLLSFFNCKNDKPTPEDTHLNYPFTKEGTLTLKNENGELLKTIDLEIAETFEETATGLMNRDSMAENQGMIFIFDQSKVNEFYMKNTRFPLDLIYISKDSLVVDIQQGTPFNNATIPSDTISQYVLELNYGMAKKWNIAEGKTKVSWKKQ